MSINDIILILMVIFFIIGAIDYRLGNRFGYGEKFREGFLAMGPLSLSMLGLVSLAPVLASWLSPIIVPIYTLFGADPAMFAGSLLAIDMGGYALAQELAMTDEAAALSGILLGTMMGPTIVFTIPVALTIIKREDKDIFAKGILIGMMTIPIGSFVGGVVANFETSMLIRNLIPATLFAVIIALGLWRAPQHVVSLFSIFGKVVEWFIIGGLIAAVVQALTGFVLIPNLTPIDEGILIVGKIAIVLAGAFPLVHFITITFNPILKWIGKKMGMNAIASAGVISSLAHVIPTLTMLDKMDNRGKVINIAFAVSGASVLGAHLGFTAGVDSTMIVPMIVGKLVAALSAVIVASLFVNVNNNISYTQSRRSEEV
ncbi:ethanolamine utilization protein EutH [Bacillus solimangrovi]|uniref:Ethanolamine utilization protein EutH n=1 Tax=Bacillus solimangrovi TaxID=1305675 RepID=A0A1E5LD59_9BACI|nr:ethanolamine utilization protein EutH [Bacillus solimangrovi]OEH92014.1 ethanolamine utilization protein EutH [Bacillus solimangrovi]